MDQNDKRISAYKKIAAFSPQKMTAEEADRANAAVRAPVPESGNTASVAGKGAAENGGAAFVPGLGVLPAFSSQKGTEKNLSGQSVPMQKNSRQTARDLSAQNLLGTGPQKMRVDFSGFEKDRSRSGSIPQDSPLLRASERGMGKTSSYADETAEPDSLRHALARNGLLKIPSSSQDSAYRRVAKFLLLIGVDEAAKVLAHLPQKQIEKIIPEIASIRSVDGDEAAVIMAEFETLVRRVRDGGGVETARNILEKAFGTELAGQMLQKAVPESGARPFDYLNDLDGERLYLLLRDETAPVRALVLSHLKPSLAAEAIKRMDSAQKTETVQRLARMTAVDPDVIRRADQGMREKMEHALSQHTDTIDGRGALAQILRRMDPLAEKEILSNLTGLDSELESDLRKRLFTIEDIVHADDRYLQTVLRSMNDADIALLIAGKPQPFRDKLCANISRGRADLVLEEEKLRSPVSRKESDAITNAFVSKLRAAWERGDFAVQERDGGEWVN